MFPDQIPRLVRIPVPPKVDFQAYVADLSPFTEVAKVVDWEMESYQVQHNPSAYRQTWKTRSTCEENEIRDAAESLNKYLGLAMQGNMNKMTEEAFMAGIYAQQTWYTWQDSTSDTQGNANTGSDTSWQYWSGSGTSGTNGTSYTDVTWGIWVTAPMPIIPETEENRIAREAQEAEHREHSKQLRAEQRERLREQKEKVAIAQAKAKALLRSVLDEQQLEDYDSNGSFIVVAASKKRYKIRSSSPLEIDENGHTLASFCIHPKASVALPDGDKMLAHKLMLDDNEKNWLKIANRTGHVRP